MGSVGVAILALVAIIAVAAVLGGTDSGDARARRERTEASSAEAAPPATTPPTAAPSPTPSGTTSTGARVPAPSIGGGSRSVTMLSTPSWIAVLASFEPSRRSEADALANSLAPSRGPIGILDSSSYSSLNPGYWVVFAGPFSDRDAARAFCSSIRRGPGPLCYDRLVER